MPDFAFPRPITLAIGKNSPDGVALLGTAFGVQNGVLATAAHVVGHDDSNLVGILPQSGDPADYQDTTRKDVRIIQLKIKAFDPVRDLALLDAPGLTLAQPPVLGTTDNAPPRTPVVTLGYPHADTGRLVLTQHSAMVGARVLLGSSALKVKHIVLNIQTRTGQSGSPVLIGDDIIAVVTGAYRPDGGGGISLGGIDPFTLHQTTHAVSAEYVKAML